MGNYFEILGCASGLAGALLVALNNRHSRYGYYLYLISNVAWITFGVMQGVGGLSVQHIGFTAISLIGIYRWNKASTQRTQ